MHGPSRETVLVFPPHFSDGVLRTSTQYQQLNAAAIGKRQKTMDEIGHPLPFQGTNALGDALGSKGFNLPLALSHGERRYALHHVHSSDEKS